MPDEAEAGSAEEQPARNKSGDRQSNLSLKSLAVPGSFLYYFRGPYALEKPALLYFTTPVSYSWSFLSTNIILANRCFAIRIIALFLFILLQYSLYFISIAGSLRITAQLLSTKAALKK